MHKAIVISIALDIRKSERIAPKFMKNSATPNVQLSKIGGSLTTPTASQMTDVTPNRCGELMSSLKELLSFRAERRSGVIETVKLVP